MPPAKRRLDPGLARQLLSEPHRFQFFQAVRLLEHLFVRGGVRAEDVVSRRLRFHNSLSLDFPPSDIEQLHAYLESGEALATPSDEQPEAWHTLHRIGLTPAFMGLSGGRGTLPLGYTERLAEREVFQRDYAARAFLDIFSNRAVALFYAAWKKPRLALQYELNRQERFLPLAMALAGMGMPSQRSRLSAKPGAVFDQSIAYFSGGLRQRPLSATFLQDMLAEHFTVPMRVELFTGSWHTVPEGEGQTRLGKHNAVLGSTALVGDRVWQRNLRLCLWFGPLRRRQFEAFLPGGSAAAALRKWLTLAVPGRFDYEVRLTLHQDDVRGVGLQQGMGGRLGWDAFVATRAATEHRSDAHYVVHTGKRS